LRQTAMLTFAEKITKASAETTEADRQIRATRFMTCIWDIACRSQVLQHDQPAWPVPRSVPQRSFPKPMIRTSPSSSLR
jgi:hypothetical protein